MDWDLSSYFKEFDGPDYRAFKQQWTHDLNQLAVQLDSLGSISAENRTEWAAWICRLEDLEVRDGHLASYLGCLNAADAENESYQKEEALHQENSTGLKTLHARLNSALGRAEAADLSALVAEPALAGAEFMLRQMCKQARFQMDDDAEALAAALNVNGIQAWSRLYDTLSGQLKFQYLDEEGKTRTVPMAQRYSLLSGSNRSVRASAFAGANQAWANHAATCNAALNSLAGARHTLDHRRGVAHFLDEACFHAHLAPATLDALFQAIDDTVQLPRDILAFRSRQMGAKQAAYYDLYAPLDLPDQESISWESGTKLVRQSFENAYPALGAFTQEILLKRWTDYQPRDGKRPGGFCTGSHLIRESRIFMTFKDTLMAVTTFAHEVGHAWHSRVMAHQRRLACAYPMTLAETASTFAEQLLTDGVLSNPDISNAQKLTLLDADTCRTIAFLLDIPVRYRWEKRFYEERKEGIVSVSRMKELMKEEQRKQFGDTLEPDGLDPFFWCSKLHYYIDGVRFYNFPYTFGYLLSVSLFARFKEEGVSFLSEYETFLEKSGSMTCEQLVRETLGESIQDPAFWRRAIESLNEPFTKLKALLN